MHHTKNGLQEYAAKGASNDGGASLARLALVTFLRAAGFNESQEAECKSLADGLFSFKFNGKKYFKLFQAD